MKIDRFMITASLYYCNMIYCYHTIVSFFVVDQRKGALDYWRIIDRIIQEIALQQDDGSDPDIAPVEIHVKHIIEKYVNLKQDYIFSLH